MISIDDRISGSSSGYSQSAFRLHWTETFNVSQYDDSNTYYEYSFSKVSPKASIIVSVTNSMGEAKGSKPHLPGSISLVWSSGHAYYFKAPPFSWNNIKLQNLYLNAHKWMCFIQFCIKKSVTFYKASEM